MSNKPGFFITLRMIVILIAEIILLPICIIMMALGNLISLGRLQDATFRMASYVFGRTGLFLAGIRLDIRYHAEKPPEPAVYLFNHCSTLDLFVITALSLPGVRYIAKKEIGYNPLFWAIAKLSGQIMINRKDPRQAITQMNRAYKYLRRNRFSLMMAPEGTRSPTGKILPFKSGAFHAAAELGYPVVPVYIEGAYALCPGKSLIARPGRITVHFHKPVDASGWSKKSIRKHADEMRERYLKWNGEVPQTGF